jgi:acyl-coenzyme A synthetase/AMP-(fatty) acid ligase
MLSIINTHLEIGASLFLTNNTIVQKDFWVDYSKNNVTSFNGVPYIYEILIKLGLNKIFTKSLKTLTQAGGKLDLDSSKIIINFCKSKKIKFFAMYGQTEASPRMTYLDWKFSEKKIGSIGKSIPGGKIILYDKKNRTIKNPNEIGELVYKGKNVSMGYSQNFEDLNLGDKNKQKLKTGDLAFFDKDKFLFLVGRKKRIVKIFGTRFDLNEIEKKMEQNGLAVACKGLDDKLGVYFIKKLKMDKVLNKLVEITGQNKIAFNLIALNKFPRTFSGKINYTKLKNIHA